MVYTYFEWIICMLHSRKHDKGTAKGTLNSVVLIYASFDFLWNESFTILGEVQSNLCMAFVAFHSIERFAW